MEKVVTIRSLKDNQNDYAYWLTKTPIERIAAIELLRQHYYPDLKNSSTKLQKIYTVKALKSY